MGDFFRQLWHLTTVDPSMLVLAATVIVVPVGGLWMLCIALKGTKNVPSHPRHRKADLEARTRKIVPKGRWMLPAEMRAPLAPPTYPEQEPGNTSTRLTLSGEWRDAWIRTDAHPSLENTGSRLYREVEEGRRSRGDQTQP